MVDKIERAFSGLSRMRFRDVLAAVIKYRYVWSVVLFAVLTALRISGSSVDMWASYLSGASSNVVLGEAKAIRSDEWMTQTPYFVAQAQSSTPYSVVNSNISISGQNMIVSYGAPVWDISMLAKPLEWGFLLFGSSVGLAWYWNMKLLLLFLFSFELCRLITKNKPMVSLLGAFWITLAPAVQWWFMQHVCDVVLHTEAVVVLFACYLKNVQKPWWVRLLIAFGFWMFGCGFVLTIYPAIQVPMAYLGLLLMGILFWQMRKQIRFRRSDGAIIASTAAFAAFLMVHVYLISGDAIQAILNTTYPGARVSNGGGGTLAEIGVSILNVFLPFTNISRVYTNSCEASSFLQFLPVALAALPVLVRKKRDNLPIGIALGASSLLALGYLFFHIPTVLAKLTLLSYVTARIVILYGYAAMLMSIWALGELGSLVKEKRLTRWYAVPVSAAIGVFLFCSIYFTELRGYVRLRYVAIVVVLFVFLSYCMLRGLKWTFGAIFSGVIFVSGAFVNPVSVGLGALTNSDLAKEVREISSQDEGAEWVAPGNFAIGNLLYANGAKTLDGTNYYPDMAKWKLIDPNGKYKKYYNRYAHITFEIKAEGEAVISTPFADQVLVQCTVQDLQKMGVKYVVSSAKMETDSTGTVTFQSLTSQPLNGYWIYQMVQS